MNMLYIKECQSLNKMMKKLFDECSSILEFFLLKHINIFLGSIDTIFKTLAKNALKFSNWKRSLKFKKLVAPIVIFLTKSS